MKKMPTMLTWLQSVNNCEMLNAEDYDKHIFKHLDFGKVSKSKLIIEKTEIM